MTSKKRNSGASNRKKAWRRGKELEEPVLKEKKSKGKKGRSLTGELTQRGGKFSPWVFIRVSVFQFWLFYFPTVWKLLFTVLRTSSVNFFIFKMGIKTSDSQHFVGSKWEPLSDLLSALHISRRSQQMSDIHMSIIPRKAEKIEGNVIIAF